MMDSRVVEAMIAALTSDEEGNPSSLHSFGQKAKYRLAQARQTVASYVGVRPQEVIFTSGGTEGINLLLRGLLPPGGRGHLITSDVEHSCVYATAKALESSGLHSSFLDVGRFGAATAEAVQQALRRDTRLILLMAVNNETGVKTDIAGIAAIAKEANIPFFVDGVALMGKEEIVIPPGVTAMAFSGHKFHAPKGIGFVVVRSHQKLSPLHTGGDQEYGRRGGTENLPGIAGLARAIELLKEELPEATSRMAVLRDRLEVGLMQRIPGVSVNGEGPRICNTSNLTFPGVEGEMLLAALDLAGIAVSHGSACASGALEPSRVLLNMGYSKSEAASSIRFSLSRFTTAEEIDCCIEHLVNIVT